MKSLAVHDLLLTMEHLSPTPGNDFDTKWQYITVPADY